MRPGAPHARTPSSRWRALLDPRRAGGALAGRAVSLLASVLLTVTAARLLGASGSGGFFAVLALATLGATAGRLGTDTMVIKVLGGGWRHPRRTVLRAARPSVLGAGTIAAVLAAAVLIGDVRWGGVGPDVLALGATAIFPLALTVTASACLRGTGRIGLGVVAETGAVPLVTLILVLGATAVFPAVGTGTVLCLYVAAAWLTALVLCPVAVGALPHHGPGEQDPPPPAWRQLLPMAATATLAYGLTWSPVFALTLADDPIQVAYYAVALRLTTLVQLVPVVQISYLAPAFARMYEHGDAAGVSALAQRSARQAAAIAAAPTLAMVVFAPAVLGTLYGSDYAPAAPVLVLLAISSTIQLLTGQVPQLMLLCDLETAAALLASAALGVWVTAGLLLSLDATGAAWLALVMTAATTLGGAAWLRQRRGIRSHV